MKGGGGEQTVELFRMPRRENLGSGSNLPLVRCLVDFGLFLLSLLIVLVCPKRNILDSKGGDNFDGNSIVR